MINTREANCVIQWIALSIISTTGAWKTEEIAQDWKNATSLLEEWHDTRKDCGDYRGIFLLSIAGKILARRLFNSLTNT